MINYRAVSEKRRHSMQSVSQLIFISISLDTEFIELANYQSELVHGFTVAGKERVEGAIPLPFSLIT